ncbi:helix-turn-helix domain-containing protein [Shewanella sp. Isolate13]|uniref:AlkA N-terminal domain-containing protein n=1 Tax=Shewanella sp. Isolate13 TaxID=2908531 RepID=UPI001EFE44C9|nr:AlkA N-terminal domain-containing protein [Shewanella sp. Isolate13]MCG9729770.1 helix-turn-helix domain-containing protein [Shewanella sp. Isolate13]
MVEHECQISKEACRKARLARDPRFDGQFFIGVCTTKIFCRPVCPAVSPKEENVRYFDTAVQAANAGLRPCLRCRPDSAPRSYAWKGTQTTLERAKALIDAGALSGLDGLSVEALSERLGISSRYLRKLFTQKLGTSVKHYAQYRQLMFAKQLLHQSNLSITQVAFAAGFNSIRRFNEVFKAQLQLTPSALRKSRGQLGDSERRLLQPLAECGQVTLRVQLSFRPPFAWQQQYDFYQLRAVKEMEWLNNNLSYGRSFSLNGVSGYFDAKLNGARNAFDVDIVLEKDSDLCQLNAIINNIRRVLDLDANIYQIDSALSLIEPLAPLMLPGLRLPGVWSAFEAGCRAVLGQQVSIVQASKLLNQLVLTYGEKRLIGEKQVTLFPTPEAIAKAELTELKMPGARKRALTALGQFVWDNPNADLEQWLSIKGIGPWTVAYARMRGLSEPDILLCGDLVVKKRVLAQYQTEQAATDKSATDKGLDYELLTQSLAKQVAPWGSYLTFQLWNLS